MSMRDRITALEQRHATPEPAVILVRGGLSECDDTRATISDATLDRDAAETFAGFHARAVALAKAAGAQFVIIGGPPD